MTSCCGGKRAQWRASDVTFPEEAETSPYDPPSPPIFEYSGKTALTVIGPYSGRTYRFEQPGSRLTIDNRDLFSLAGISVLTRILPE